MPTALSPGNMCSGPRFRVTTHHDTQQLKTPNNVIQRVRFFGGAIVCLASVDFSAGGGRFGFLDSLGFLPRPATPPPPIDVKSVSMNRLTVHIPIQTTHRLRPVQSLMCMDITSFRAHLQAQAPWCCVALTRASTVRHFMLNSISIHVNDGVNHIPSTITSQRPPNILHDKALP